MKTIILFLSLFVASYFSNAQITLNLKLFIEGYYLQSNTGLMDNNGNGGCLFINNISNDSADADTMCVSLIDPGSAAVKGIVKGILKTDGSLVVDFDSSIVQGHSYFIRVQHRSAVETWSSNPIVVSAVTNYDFSTSASQAFWNNMTNVGTVSQPVWAFYSGDFADAGSAQICVQDGVIEGQDYNEMEGAVFVHLTGYVCQDITGDGEVDSLDYAVEENNVFIVIFSMRPYNIGIDEINPEKIKNNFIKCFSDGEHLHFVQPQNISQGIVIIYAMDGGMVFKNEFNSVENFNALVLGNRFPAGIYGLVIESDK